MLVMFYNVVFTIAIFLFKRLHMVVLIGLIDSLGGLLERIVSKFISCINKSISCVIGILLYFTKIYVYGSRLELMVVGGRSY